MANYPLPPEELEAAMGYTYRDRALLERALTHSSYSNELGVPEHHLLCNERLEFLGDSVLSIITSEYLFEHFKDCPEGDLTRMRADVVCERALAGYAEQIGLGNYLHLGKGEDRNNGRHRPSIVADAFEALLASLYLDAGKARVTEFLLPFISEAISALKPGGFHGDCKTRLQQFVQQNEGDFLEYVTVGESGPDHRKTFVVEAKLNGNVIGRGEGRSKRMAEQAAAGAALVLFGMNEE
jgi:ribonuclease-3